MGSVLGLLAGTYICVAVVIYIIIHLIEVVLDLPLYENEECPGVSHVKLKRLIEKIVQETLRLPTLLDYSGVSGRPEDNLPFFDPKKYQELLATAVLNKIVDSYNYEKKFETDNNQDLDKNHNPIIANKRKVLQQSSSSIEPGSDSSIADATVHISRDGDAYTSDTDSNFQSDLITGSVHTGDESVLSDYISKHKVPLPEFSLDTESPDDDIMSVVTSKSEGNWEDNWLFKKKKRGNDTPVSVGMLVPSPREDVKTLIGDKTADEISDLSEGSDFEDLEGVDNKSPNDTDLPNVLIQNKNVIGGKSTVGLFDELLEQTSLISTTSVPEGEAMFNECKNDFILTNDGLDEVQPAPKLDLTNNHHQVIVENEAVNSNVSDFLTNGSASHEEQTIEDTPVFAPPQDFDDAEQPSLEQASNSISECEAVTVEKVELADEAASNLDSLSQGSIAERERLKWYQAVEMPNNPYAPEALKHRLSIGSEKPIDIPNISISLDLAASQGQATNLEEDSDGSSKLQIVLGADKPDQKRYGRDYYINDAKYACGTSSNSETFKDSRLSLSLSEDDHQQDNKVTQDNENYWKISKPVRKTSSLRSFRCISNSSLYRNTNRPNNDHFYYTLPKATVRPKPLTQLSETDVLKQFERKLLHEDLRRNSFRWRSSTRNFVLNPIYDHDPDDQSLKSGESLDGCDSGVHSFTNLSLDIPSNHNKSQKSSIKRSSSLKLRDLASLW